MRSFRSPKRAQRPNRKRRRLRGEPLERRQLLAADFFHNHFDPEDVNDDGLVSAIDALAVINAIGRNDVSAGGNAGPNPNASDINPTGTNRFTDVNNDGRQSALDALMVINRISRRDRGADPRQTLPRVPELAIPAAPDEFRSIDGTGNNLADPLLGSAGQNLIRMADADYSDGIAEPAGAERPGAREISNQLSSVSGLEARSGRDLTAFIYVWGQFLDHDIDLSGGPDDPADEEAFDIPVPTDDVLFNPTGASDVVIPFTRSGFDSETGTSEDNPRQQVNEITSYIDGSQVYGSDQETADSLREFEGGRLLVRDEGLLPVNDQGQVVAGDIRAAENPSLTSLHTLFVREHNRIADQIAADEPGLTDEEIYQRARAVVIAEIQSITYNEFLPALLGQRALTRYAGYDSTVNPTIANEFSTAAYRFGHSTLNDDLEFFGNDGRAVADAIELADAFFHPEVLEETGIDSLLKYNASSLSQEIDLKMVDGLRNFLFGPPGSGGLDLAALNIQRGRDHGLADYNATRVAYGLDAYESFADLTSDPETQAKLETLYGDINDVDLWVGLLAEDHVRGASVGELTRTILADQFQRLRDGDRFYYQNVFSGRDLAIIEQTSLADVIERNTDVEGLQENVFFFLAEIRGTIRAGATNDTPVANGRRRTGDGVEGVVVELLDDAGNVIETATSDRRGQYRFRNFVETGGYQVRVAATGESVDVLLSTGGQRAGGVDFLV